MENAHYLTHRAGTIVCGQHGYKAGSALLCVEPTHYLTAWLAWSPAWKPSGGERSLLNPPGLDRCVREAWLQGWQCNTMCVEPTHYLTHLVGTVMRSPRGQCGAHSLLDPPGWDRYAQAAWSVWSPLIT